MTPLTEKELRAFHEESKAFQPKQEWEQFMEKRGSLKIYPDGQISIADANNYAAHDDMYFQLKKWRMRNKLTKPVTPVDWAEAENKKRDILKGYHYPQGHDEEIDVDEIPF